MQRRIICLEDKPNAKSYGTIALIVQEANGYMLYGHDLPYKIAENKFIESINMLYQFDKDVPEHLVNPIALWIGNIFRENVKKYTAPEIPCLDESWFTPKEPYHDIGYLTLMEYRECHEFIDRWLMKAGKQALKEGSKELLNLMNWTNPMSPYTEAVAYYLASDSKKKENVLKFQANILQLDQPLSTYDVLILEDIVKIGKRDTAKLLEQHKRVRAFLLSQQ